MPRHLQQYCCLHVLVLLGTCHIFLAGYSSVIATCHGYTCPNIISVAQRIFPAFTSDFGKMVWNQRTGLQPPEFIIASSVSQLCETQASPKTSKVRTPKYHDSRTMVSSQNKGRLTSNRILVRRPMVLQLSGREGDLTHNRLMIDPYRSISMSSVAGDLPP